MWISKRKKKDLATIIRVYRIAKKHKEITTILIQKELNIGYGRTYRAIDALIVLGLLKKEGYPGHYKYCLIEKK